MAKKCVSCISGGVDSFSIAILMSRRGYEIHPIVFNYKQKAAKEEQVVEKLCNKLNFMKPLKISIGGDVEKIWSGRQLIDRNVEIQQVFQPSIIVPIRNAIFVTIAASYALNIGAEAVTYGGLIDDTDFPDSRPRVARIIEELVKYAHPPAGFHKVRVISPATEGLSKFEMIKIAYGIVGDLLFETWSCYAGGEKHCGECMSCLKRHEAFVKAGIIDKTEYLKQPKNLGGV